MKVDANQTIPITVDIDEDEIYRIARGEINKIYGIPIGAEVRDGVLYKVWMESCGQYDPEEMKEKIRDATEEDIHACHVLERLQADYKGWKYAKQY